MSVAGGHLGPPDDFPLPTSPTSLSTDLSIALEADQSPIQSPIQPSIQFQFQFQFRSRFPFQIPFPFVPNPVFIPDPVSVPAPAPVPFLFPIPFCSQSRSCFIHQHTPSIMPTMPSVAEDQNPGKTPPLGRREVIPETLPGPPPFSSKHLEWCCRVDGPSVPEPVVVTALIDNGSHSVLIDDRLVTKLGLRRRWLPFPQRARLAMGEEEVVFTEWVKLWVCSDDQQWTARVVRAVVAPKLAYPILLGGPFLEWNKIIIDHEFGRVTAKDEHYQLLPVVQDGPVPVDGPQDEPMGPGERRIGPGARGPKDVLQELQERTKETKDRLDERSTTGPSYGHFAKTLDDRIYVLAVLDDLAKDEQEVRDEFKDRFPMDIPHVTRLPDDVYHRFRLKDPEKVIKCRSYACPRKYKNVWKQLLDQHLAAGRIRESSSEYCSPSFLIPKADPTVLPRWVNDYRALNENTIPDHYPLPRVETILSDCASLQAPAENTYRGCVICGLVVSASFRQHSRTLPKTESCFENDP